MTPGYRSIRIQPCIPEDVDEVRAVVPCPYGEISFSWKILYKSLFLEAPVWYDAEKYRYHNWQEFYEICQKGARGT